MSHFYIFVGEQSDQTKTAVFFFWMYLMVPEDHRSRTYLSMAWLILVSKGVCNRPDNKGMMVEKVCKHQQSDINKGIICVKCTN